MLQVPGDGSIIKEDNVTHSFCGLACVGWMYQKIKDSFFLILAHIPVPIFCRTLLA